MTKIALLDTNNFHYTKQGLMVHGIPTFADCEEQLTILRTVSNAAQLWIGDLLNYMEGAFGEEYAQVLDALDYSAGSMANMKSVAKAFPPSRRREQAIPFSYYQAVQGLPVDEQESLLDKVELGEITSLRHLRNKAKKTKTAEGQEPCIHETVKTCIRCGEVIDE